MTMKAAVMREAGGPEVLRIENLPVPQPRSGQVLIRVKAFGVNRSEMFTRQGHSPGLTFPRVLGIEAAGVVEEAPGGEFQKGEIVLTAMGGMGRQFDGGYAEYTCVPASQVQGIGVTALPWETLGAMPEMLQTAWGSLFRSLVLARGATADPGRYDVGGAGCGSDCEEPWDSGGGDDAQCGPRGIAAGQRGG